MNGRFNPVIPGCGSNAEEIQAMHQGVHHSSDQFTEVADDTREDMQTSLAGGSGSVFHCQPVNCFNDTKYLGTNAGKAARALDEHTAPAFIFLIQLESLLGQTSLLRDHQL